MSVSSHQVPRTWCQSTLSCPRTLPEKDCLRNGHRPRTARHRRPLEHLLRKPHPRSRRLDITSLHHSVPQIHIPYPSNLSIRLLPRLPLPTPHPLSRTQHIRQQIPRNIHNPPQIVRIQPRDLLSRRRGDLHRGPQQPGYTAPSPPHRLPRHDGEGEVRTRETSCCCPHG